MVLRPFNNDTFQVVGRAYVDGLMDAQGVLGTVPEPWKVMVQRFTPKGDIWTFVHKETGDVVHEDPRLGPLPVGWTIMDDGRFSHAESGKMTEEDPRWNIENLKKRGIDLTEFHLV